jgi:hypothetical protein
MRRLRRNTVCESLVSSSKAPCGRLPLVYRGPYLAIRNCGRLSYFGAYSGSHRGRRSTLRALKPGLRGGDMPRERNLPCDGALLHWGLSDDVSGPRT